MTDRHRLYLAAFVRALATGMVGVLLGVYLAELNLDADAIGVVVGAGLSGAAVATLLATLLADRIGRRRSLLAITLLSCAGATALLFTREVTALAIVAFVGMVNGMGRDRAAALVLEQAALPATVSDSERTLVFARYNVLQDVGHAIGALLAALPTLLERANLGPPRNFQLAIGVYAALSLLPAIAYWSLSTHIEAPSTRRVPLTPQSKRILWKISALFGLDSLGGGFLTTALLSFFFYERFGASVGTIALLFFAARIANAASHLAAAWLAKRIGLVNTMVFTHLPSSLLLITVAWAPDFATAAVLFLLREALVEMDVPTRQSYVMAVVAPEERTTASGVTHLVRLGAWAIAPSIAGLLMAGTALVVPLFIGAGLKILYDLLLWRALRQVRPPEERQIA